VEGQNIALEYRYAEGLYERLPDLAAEISRFPVDILFVQSALGAQAAKQVTTTIPIVMETLADPVAFGLVEGLARPGGNLTGVSGFAPELSGKHLELLKEVVPGLLRVAVLINPTNPNAPSIWQDTERAAQALGVRLQRVEIHESDALEGALATAIRAHAAGLMVVLDPLLHSQRGRIVDFATRHRVPVIAEVKMFAEAGGLMTYGPSRPAQWQRAAYYVDRLLKGAKPADLPVEQPTQFELVINLKTAQALGVTIPPSVLFRADEVLN
jgi:putative ABC transport system substrate-binding protein